MEDNFSWQLRAFRAAVIFLLIPTLFSCEEQFDYPPACLGGECEARMLFSTPADENGYYHVKLNWNRDYLPYFLVDVEASDVNPLYRYNEISVVSAEFDTDKYWELGSSVTYTLPLYNFLESNYSVSGNLLSVGTTTVVLNQFEGTVMNLVQNTSIYFSNNKNSKVYSRRTVGPIPPTFIGDTVTLKMKVFWDASSQSVLKKNIYEKFIVE